VEDLGKTWLEHAGAWGKTQDKMVDFCMVNLYGGLMFGGCIYDMNYYLVQLVSNR
jgi:hypothetical protein